MVSRAMSTATQTKGTWILFLEARAKMLVESFPSSQGLSLWQTSFPSVQESQLSTNRVLRAFILLLHPRAGRQHSSWLFSKPTLLGWEYELQTLAYGYWHFLTCLSWEIQEHRQVLWDLKLCKIFRGCLEEKLYSVLKTKLGTQLALCHIPKMSMTFQNHQPDGRCGEVEDGVERDSSLANWVKMSSLAT